MGRNYSVLTHPQKAAIERDILKGMSCQEVAKKHSNENIKISRGAVSRYRDEHMLQMLRHAQLETIEGFIGRIDEHMDFIEELRDSILEVLDNPDNPGHICYYPNAMETKIKYYDKETEKWAVAKLEELLSKVKENKPDIVVKGVYIEAQDPRVTLLKTTDVLNRQLELLCKAKGYITEDNNITINAGASGTVEDIANIAREALAPYPEALDAFVNALLDAAAKGDRELMATTGDEQK